MHKQFKNPFYLLLLMVGIAFVITACAYAVMTVRGIGPVPSASASLPGQPLMKFMDRHGFGLLMGELLVLGVTTFAAMATDRYWMR